MGRTRAARCLLPGPEAANAHRSGMVHAEPRRVNAVTTTLAYRDEPTHNTSRAALTWCDMLGDASMRVMLIMARPTTVLAVNLPPTASVRESCGSATPCANGASTPSPCIEVEVQEGARLAQWRFDVEGERFIELCLHSVLLRHHVHNRVRLSTAAGVAPRTSQGYTQWRPDGKSGRRQHVRLDYAGATELQDGVLVDQPELIRQQLGVGHLSTHTRHRRP